MPTTAALATKPSPIRVSVVVPVYNPGTSFDDLIASLDRQSLPFDRFEVLLCDDGSDETTQLRLRAVAATRPYVRVLSLPHSGWPGTPRNEGVAAAAGTYVQFVDQDDWLFDEALERLCEFADENSSDVVVGKELGIGRRLPRRIFSQDVPRAVLGTDPLLEMLTPHKMFRTAFLREKGIRFPDGRVRLEDHLFVMRAYFEASTISILASTPCYAWVKQPGSASSARIDPATYFPHLEAVLDLVERYTEPGRLRDRLLRHWFRGKILARLSGRKMVRYPAAYRDELVDVVGPLAARRFGPGVDAGLAFPHRIRAALLRADRREDLLRLAGFESDIECTATVTSARWSRGGGLSLTIRVTIRHDGRDALEFAGDPLRLTSLPIDDLPDSALRPGRELDNDHVELLVSDADGEPRRLARMKPADLRSIEVAMDPLRAFGQDDESVTAALSVKVRRAGWTFEVPLQADAATLAAAGRSPMLAGRACRPMTAPDGSVALRRSMSGGWRDSAGRATRRIRAFTGRESGSQRRRP